VIRRRTLGTFITETARAGLVVDALVESPLDATLAGEAHYDPAQWCSVARARLMPTTFVLKAHKPAADSHGPST
jgi:hypothetical protein